jgi:hypothetical protein
VREETLRAANLAIIGHHRGGRHVDDEVLAHISPAHSENVNFFGAIEVDIDAELAQLGPTGYRPLRAGDTPVLNFSITASLVGVVAVG